MVIMAVVCGPFYSLIDRIMRPGNTRNINVFMLCMGKSVYHKEYEKIENRKFKN